MNTSNRQTLITKCHKVLKKHYEPVAPPADRPVLEHLLYACCLENGKYEHVDEIFAKIEQSYFDWNEVRVTTVAELAEVMAAVPDATEAARRLKRSLQSVFESQYSFDLEFLKKQNLGKAIEHLEKFSGVTPFAAAYVTQNALGGHAIPLNQSAYELLQLLGVVSDAEAAKHRVPGLERAIPKNKGVEFASLLHQLSMDYAVTPHSPRVRGILLEITPDAKERLPKRTTRKDSDTPAELPAAKPLTAKPPAAKPPAAKPPADAAPPPGKSGKSHENIESGGEELAADSSRKEKSKSPAKRLSRKKPR